jgi:hypothetical protein
MTGVSGGVGPFGGADSLEKADNHGGFSVGVAHLIGLANDEEKACGKDGRCGGPAGKAPTPGEPATEGGGHSDDGAGEKKQEQDERD